MRSTLRRDPLRRPIVLLAGLVLSLSVAAQTPSPPADAPAGTTAKCKDDTYYSGSSKKGACSHHGGIAQWYGKPATSKSGSSSAGGGTGASTGTGGSAGTGAAAGAAASGGASSSTHSATSGKSASSGPPPNTAPAPGGGPGQVWVNTSSKVYHCPGDHWYGKTKQGEYMTEAAAKAAGDRPDHNKPCS